MVVLHGYVVHGCVAKCLCGFCNEYIVSVDFVSELYERTFFVFFVLMCTHCICVSSECSVEVILFVC